MIEGVRLAADTRLREVRDWAVEAEGQGIPEVPLALQNKAKFLIGFDGPKVAGAFLTGKLDHPFETWVTRNDGVLEFLMACLPKI